jgi:formylglycine-generating enzyme
MAPPGGLRRAAIAAALVAWVAGCAAVIGIDTLEIGECRGGVCEPDGGIILEDTGVTIEGGGQDVQRPDTGAPCIGAGGPEMVRVGDEDNSFCIDATEVTFGQYRAFLLAKGGDTSGQAAECTWNHSFQPALGGDDELPVNGVDWCDARAFCQWAGKDLCGKQVEGQRVGPVTTDDLESFETHQWLLACSARGQRRYPYGGTHRPTACNTGDNDAGRTLPVGSMPECVGGYPGVHDMIGNVWEWYDGPCFPSDAGALADGGDGGPARHECLVKGGSFEASGLNLDCAVEARGTLRERASADIGFRCCSP